MLPNEVFKLVMGPITVAMISVIMIPKHLVRANQLEHGNNISLLNHLTGSHELPLGRMHLSKSGQSDYNQDRVLKELAKKPTMKQVAGSESIRWSDKGNTLIGHTSNSDSFKINTFPRERSDTRSKLGEKGKKRVFNFSFVDPPPPEDSMVEKMTGSASSTRENWATFHGGSLDDSEDTTITPEFNSNRSKQPSSSSTTQQKETPSTANEELTTSNESTADSTAEAASPTKQQQQVQLEKESFSETEKPVIRKSSSTLTTIGDGKKKARLVSKSAPLPPGLRRRIIEEFVRKGGNPDNIVISDSTITTTSKSKKKTITTVYKVVPTGGSPSPRQARKMGGKAPPSSPIRPKQPPGKKFKKIMTVSRDEMPKNMISNSPDGLDKPNTATFTDMGLVEFDDNTDEMPNGKPEGLHIKSKRPPLKLRIVPPPSIVDGDDEEDEIAPITKGKIKPGVGGGGVSLNTLMDAIKNMQHQQQGKPKLEDANLSIGDKEHGFGKHLSNFNDFNGQKSSKKATSLAKNSSSSSDEAKNNDEEEDEEEPETDKENNEVDKKPPEVEEKKVTAGSTGRGSDKVSPEQQLEELKRVVVASTEKLKERRAKALLGGSEDKKGSIAPNTTSAPEQQKSTPAPQTTARPASMDGGSQKNSTVSEQSSQKGNGGGKTHNIMMLIDFRNPNKLSESRRRSPRAHSARLNLHHPQSGFFPGTSWLDPDDQWHPLTADTGTNLQLSSHAYPHSFTPGLPVDSLIPDEQFGLDGIRERLPLTSESDSFGTSFDYMDAAADHRGSHRSQLMGFGVPTRAHYQHKALPNHLYDMTSASEHHNNYRPTSGPLSALFGGASGQAPHSLAASAFMSLIHRAPSFHHHHQQQQQQAHKLSSYSSILPEESRSTNQLVNDVIEELVMSASDEMGSMTGTNGTRRSQLYSVTGTRHPTYQLNRRRLR